MPIAAAVQVAGAGASPPVVFTRWMKVVSPSAPGVVETADSSSHGIAVASPGVLAELADDLAGVLGLPRRPREVGDDQLAAAVMA